MRLSIISVIVFFSLALVMPEMATAARRYSNILCKQSSFDCVKIKRGETWHSKWPDAEDRAVIKRINRMNTRLYAGTVIAVPKEGNNLDLMDYSPFKNQIDTQGRRTLVMNPRTLAWGAYDEDGDLVRWGPASFGKSYCPDVNRRCLTVRGQFTIYTKRGAGCVSTKFPIGEGGAPMPYCMFFHGGYAVHGSPTVPGYNASHGCVRVFSEDAHWLNTEFVGSPGNTRVIVLPY